MTWWLETAIWLTRGVVFVAVLGAVLPLIRGGAWYFRVWDFPRVQMAALSLAGAAAALALCIALGWRADLAVMLAIAALASIAQLSSIAPYTRLWRPHVKGADQHNLRLVVMNLDVRNDQRRKVGPVIRDLSPDVLLLIEIDSEWAAALAGERALFAHHVETIRDEGLGIALWSRAPLRGARIEHLVSEKRPSITGELDLPEGPAHFIGLHPTPPALAVRDGEGRYDSRIRDAELMKVAQRIAEAKTAGDTRPWIVAGDLNDVAWSHTNRLFGEVSGLKDPRVGRAMLNTYHARRPLLRYPVDHVFVSAGVGVAELHRIATPGSDHFAVVTDLMVRAREPVDNDADPDNGEAKKQIREGERDAAERNETSGTTSGAARPALSGGQRG